MTNLRLGSLSIVVFAMMAGAVSAITPACGPEIVSSGPGVSGSGATQSVGNLAAGSSSLAGTGGTSTECPAGSERCTCYGNNTCNAGLVCASQRCVNITGLVGGTGGTSANGGDTNTGVVASGGSLATGGRSTNGGVAATGGSMPAAGALGAGGDSFWKNVTYSAATLPDPSDGNHNPGQNCIQCHTAGTNSEAPVWLFGGTVYQADGTTPAPHVQVGVNDGTKLYTAYSATNGNFWLGGSGNINWANAQVRIRDANGELMMAGATPAPTCNLCHNATTYPRITAP